nr:skin secretory protein xP2-like [Setaria viridis]
MANIVDSRPPVLEDAERRQRNRFLAEEQKSAPRDFVPPLAPKKALQVSSASVGRAATPPAASGGVARETTKPTVEEPSATTTGGKMPQPGAGQGLTPAPPSFSVANPAGQGVAPGVPPSHEVIDLDDDAVEEPAAPVAAEVGMAAPAIVTKAPVAVEAGTPAQVATTETLAVARAGMPAPKIMTEAGTPTPADVTEAAAVVGMGTPAPKALTEMVVDATGPSSRTAALEAVAHAPVAALETAASGAARAAPTLALFNPVPKAWGGPTLRWRVRDDPQQPLFMLDDAEE